MNIKGVDVIVDINKVNANTWNPKEKIEENEANRKYYEEIRQQIKEKGLFEAITVREFGEGFEILDGFHRWSACKELGFKEIRINNLGEIDDKLARAITLVKEQKKVPISELRVADVIGWYKEQGDSDKEIKELLGYDDKVMDEYTALLEFNWSDFKVEIEQGEDDEVEEKKEEGELYEERKIVIKLEREKFVEVKEKYERLGGAGLIEELVS